MFKDYLFFRRMFIPFLIEFVFWIGILASVVTGIANFYQGFVVQGLVTIIVGPILVRMICEYFIVLFRINDTLTDIKELMAKRVDGQAPTVEFKNPTDKI